jgi:hypothetical protein
LFGGQTGTSEPGVKDVGKQEKWAFEGLFASLDDFVATPNFLRHLLNQFKPQLDSFAQRGCVPLHCVQRVCNRVENSQQIFAIFQNASILQGPTGWISWG